MLTTLTLLQATLVQQIDPFLEACGNNVEAARMQCTREADFNALLSCTNEIMSPESIAKCKAWFKEVMQLPIDGELPKLSESQEAEMTQMGEESALSSSSLLVDYCPNTSRVNRLVKREDPVINFLREKSLLAFKGFFGIYVVAVGLGIYFWMIPFSIATSIVTLPIFVMHGTKAVDQANQKCMEFLLHGYFIATGYTPLNWVAGQFPEFFKWWAFGPKEGASK
eukprot:NODE_619_length_5349_cov_0.609524.p3 type:complete len:224 gc:universal NODE_619_length_5349_cov_0.609524:1029-358(-)